MNKDAERIKIAEKLGWTWWKHTKSDTFIFCHPDRNKESLDDAKMQWNKVEHPKQFQNFVSLAGVPDFVNDLNACAEMEKVLKFTKTPPTNRRNES